MTLTRAVVFLFPLLLFLVGCGGSGDDADTTASPTLDVVNMTAATDTSWSYEGDTGPEQWADLSDTYASCNGTEQSPIALSDATPQTSRPPFETSYSTAKGKVVDTGYALQVNLDGGTLTYQRTTYDLKQFHVHAPSEHTLDGTTYPAEVHLVHQTGNKIAILGIFVEEGDLGNPVFNTWTTGADTTVFIRANRFLPDSRAYYTYEGSLPTPPCLEGVRWIMMKTPITASAEQLEALRAQYDGNARPVQPLGDRTLTYVE